MYEDMQMICNDLLIAMRRTSHLCDLLALTYDEKSETVTATFVNGHEKYIDVRADSGYAMIYDIVYMLS